MIETIKSCMFFMLLFVFVFHCTFLIESRERLRTLFNVSFLTYSFLLDEIN